jgi:hypothetical protein
MEKGSPKRKAIPARVEFLRCLPLSVKESLLKEEVDAILFEDVWPDSLLEKLKDYFEKD